MVRTPKLNYEAMRSQHQRGSHLNVDRGIVLDKNWRISRRESLLACGARRYSFEKIGIDEVELDDKWKRTPDDDGMYKVKSEMYTKQRITVKPVGDMRVRVSFANSNTR